MDNRAEDPARRPEREAADWFLWLVENPDDAGLTERFEVWRAADPLNDAAWHRISTVGQDLARAGRHPAPEPWPRRRGRPTPQSPVDQRRSGRRAIAAVAALALLALLPAGPGLLLRVRADERTGTADLKRIALRDGSSVMLAPDSAIAVSDTGDGREIRLLAGKAWFDVRHDPDHPFRVVAGDVTTIDLGTRFEVGVTPGGAAIDVAEGSVRVEHGPPGAREERDLFAGNSVGVDGDAPLQVVHFPSELMGSWRDRRLSIDNRTIADAIDELRPWYGGRIVVLDRVWSAQRVTGIYDLRDPAKVLEDIIYPEGGRITRITPWLTIVSPA